MNNTTHTKPEWLIEDLGSRGVQLVDWTEFAVPPEDTWGCLFAEDRIENGYHLEEIKPNIYWLSTGWYDMMFAVTETGVVAFDAPISLGENIMEAIRRVTDMPVTHVIYSHWHSDHIGATPVYGEGVEIIANERTKDLLERFPDENRPVPTTTFDRELNLEIGGLEIEMKFIGQSHSQDLIFSFLPQHKVLMAVDIASPGWVTFRDADASENFSGYVEAFEKILEYDFDVVVSGHVSKLGGRADVEEGLEYMRDLEKYAKKALETVDIEYFTKQLENTPYKAAFRFAEENYFQAATNYGTKLMLETPTSNGKLWHERLNGVEAFTAHNIYAMIEHTRLEKPHGGYITKQGKPFPEWYA